MTCWMYLVYFDSSDRLIATTMNPLAVVGDFAFLKVSAVDKVAAFLDWGLEKTSYFRTGNKLIPYKRVTIIRYMFLQMTEEGLPLPCILRSSLRRMSVN